MPSHREPGLRMIDAGDGRVFEIFEQIEPRREDRVSCVVLAPKARFGDGGDRLCSGSDTEPWKPWQSWGGGAGACAWTPRAGRQTGLAFDRFWRVGWAAVWPGSRCRNSFSGSDLPGSRRMVRPRFGAWFGPGR